MDQPVSTRSPAALAWSTSTSCWSIPSRCSKIWCWEPRAAPCWRAAWRWRGRSWRGSPGIRLAVDPDARVADLSVGEQQRVEILKVLYRGARILILDEPSAVLTPRRPTSYSASWVRSRARRHDRADHHKLREIMAVTDHVYVMRQGEIVADRPTRETSPEGWLN